MSKKFDGWSISKDGELWRGKVFFQTEESAKLWLSSHVSHTSKLLGVTVYKIVKVKLVEMPDE